MGLSRSKSRAGSRFAGAMLSPLLASAGASAAQAEIVRMVIDRRAPAEDAGNSGRSGAYEEIRGRVFGEVDPKRPENAIIQDLDAAPVNARGKVEYISTFTLLRPVDRSKNSGVLLAPLPNRGGRGVASWRTSKGLIDPLFYDRGYSVLWVGWQADLPERPSANSSAAALKMESMLAPMARRPDRKPLTGRYLVRVPTLGGSGPSGSIMKLDQGRAGTLAYMPLNFDTRTATLTGGAPEDINGKPTGPRYTIAPQDWTWWNCKTDTAPVANANPGDLCVKRLKGSFKPGETYLLVFTVRDPLVMALGMAAIRDTISFFRYQQADTAGTANPLSGHVKHVVGQGVSQVGNLVKTFIALGFNGDERGRRVWDGAHTHIAGRLAPINYRFSTPGSSTTLFMPGSEGILWWGKAVDGLRGGPPRSTLDRCEANGTCPRIFETFGGAELWNQRMTPGLVNFDLKSDIPLPANVRRYYFPGTQHGGGVGGFRLDHASGVCTLPLNPNPQTDQVRALTIALVDWVATGKAPPPSAYPTLAKGDLVPDQQSAFRFPRIPGLPSPYGIANPVLVYDFGLQFNYINMTGVITKQPAPDQGTRSRTGCAGQSGRQRDERRAVGAAHGAAGEFPQLEHLQPRPLCGPDLLLQCRLRAFRPHPLRSPCGGPAPVDRGTLSDAAGLCRSRARGCGEGGTGGLPPPRRRRATGARGNGSDPIGRSCFPQALTLAR